MSDIKERLMYLMREHNNISTLKLSERTNIPQPTLHHIISGKTKNPRNHVKESLAFFFGITVNQLTGKEELTSIMTKAEITKNHAGKYIPILAYNETDHDEKLLVEYSEPYNLAILLNTDDFVPMFQENCLLIGTTGKEFIKDRGYVFIKEKNHQQYIAKVFKDAESIFLLKLSKNKAEEKNLLPLNKIDYSIIMFIKETRNKF